MSAPAEATRIDLAHYVNRARQAPMPMASGRVHQIVGMLVEVIGITPAVGTQLQVDLGTRQLQLEVLGFREGRALTAPLGSTAGVEPGAVVTVRPHGADVAVGDALLGRVIDAFGQPLDGRPTPKTDTRVPLYAPPPSPFTRRAIKASVETGVRVLDALLPLGHGQRIGLFAGTGVGKSTLLGMLCRHAKADVVVVGLVGERGREVGDFVRGALGEEGLKRSVVVAATSDKAPLVRVRGALRATAIAEYFRDQGKSVLLVMDSVTRFAMALREATLAAGEPPLSKGYTPSVFAALPALLERAGTTASAGSITAVYTVLVEGDDLQDPIADAVRGILDGHVVLSRKLADRGLFPAIDVLRSISRLATEICTKDHLKLASVTRDLMATYADAQDLIQIGAYVAGSDPRIDAARAAVPVIETMIRQSLTEAIPQAQSLAALTGIAQVAAQANALAARKK